MEHPDAYGVPAIGRAQIPLDDLAVRMVGELSARSASLRLSEDARLALMALREQARREAGAGSRGADGEGGEAGSWSDGGGSGDGGSESERRRDQAMASRLDALDEVALCRDRRGRQWILLAAVHTPLARVLAERAGLRAGEGPAGTYALAAVTHDAAQIAELLDQLEAGSVDPRVSAWLERATEWRGNIEVGSAEVGAPARSRCSCCWGTPTACPPPCASARATVPGGASVPLTLESWRLMDGRLRGWVSSPRGAARRRCARGARRRPRCWSARRSHDDPTFVLAPGHDPAQLEAFAALAGSAAGQAAAWRRRGARARQAAGDPRRPFCVPELDAFLAEHGTWVEPGALELLQEVREEHARAAGLVALSAATDATLEIPGLGGELKPFQRAGVSYMLASGAPSSPTSRASARRSRRSRRWRPTAPTRRWWCARRASSSTGCARSSAGCRGAACAR